LEPFCPGNAFKWTKSKGLIDVLREGGIARNRSGYLDNQSEDLDVQAGRFREEPEPVGFEVNDLKNMLVFIRKLQNSAFPPLGWGFLGVSCTASWHNSDSKESA
jgi:hypothetical protein